MENNKILAAILMIVSINLLLTIFLLIETRTYNPYGKPSITLGDVEESDVKHITDKLIVNYNKGDGLAIYDMFDDIVKTKIDKPQVFAIFNKQKATVGKISLYTFSGAQKAGMEAGKDVYNVLYNFRSDGDVYSKGNMTVTVLKKDNDTYSLLGFFIHGQEIAQ